MTSVKIIKMTRRDLKIKGTENVVSQAAEDCEQKIFFEIRVSVLLS